jgi:copper oxidase (laccase) domain-containing protein
MRARHAENDDERIAARHSGWRNAHERIALRCGETLLKPE